MAKSVYVFRAKLSGWRGVHRTIAVPCESTLDDLHYALQAAFGWGDDHLYAFWLGRKFWAKDKASYVHPLALEADSLMREGAHARRRRRSAERRLDRLRLSPGQRIAYLFDFEAQWRVRLTLREIAANDGGHYPRIVESIGAAPAQHLNYDELAKAA
jgi:Plasmid pRiA4b ORF-3-like protein